MKTYLVGGAVRDILRGQTPKDRDYVVVGATPEQMTAVGFKQVGADFPVFLHPETREEYALARTETKTGQGHRGFITDFAPSVTLEDDLFRRDLTINAMAMEADGTVIDPFGGKTDLENGILRAVSPHFAEDPLRVLRCARFAAKFDFAIAPETIGLCRQIAASEEFESLTAERVGLELLKALNTDRPSRFFTTLDQCNALAVHFPEIHALKGQTQPEKHHPEGDAFVHTMMVLDQSAKLEMDTKRRFGCLVHDLGKGTTPKEDLPKHHDHEERGVPLVLAMCNRLRLSNELKQAGRACARYHTHVHKIDELNPKSIIKLFTNLGGDHTLQHVELVADVAQCDARGRGGAFFERDYPERETFFALMLALSEIKARSLFNTEDIKDMPYERILNALQHARLHWIRDNRPISGPEASSPAR